MTKYCNLCGKALDAFDEQQEFVIHNEKIGYGSVHDGDSVHLQLCCDCMDKLAEQCMIDPIIDVERGDGIVV